MAELIQTNYRMRIEGLSGWLRDGSLEEGEDAGDAHAKFHLELYLSTNDAEELSLAVQFKVGEETRTATVYVPLAAGMEVARFIRHLQHTVDAIDDEVA